MVKVIKYHIKIEHIALLSYCSLLGWILELLFYFIFRFYIAPHIACKTVAIITIYRYYNRKKLNQHFSTFIFQLSLICSKDINPLTPLSDYPINPREIETALLLFSTTTHHDVQHPQPYVLVSNILWSWIL